MDYNELVWIIKAYGPGRELIYWAFSKEEAISILEDLRDNYDDMDMLISLELTNKPT